MLVPLGSLVGTEGLRQTSRANSMAGRPSGFKLAICALFHYAALVNVGSASSGGGVFVCVCGEEMADIGY